MTPSLGEVARDLNAIKTERAHARIVLPSEAQEDENYRLVGELLKGTGIAQDELAAIALEVGQSAVHALDRAAPEGGIDGMELIGLIASLWIDGVILGTRYMQNRDVEALVILHRLLLDKVRDWLETTRVPGIREHRPELYVGDDEQFAALWHSAIRLRGAESVPDSPNGAEPAYGTDPTRTAAQDDPRGERDR